MKSAILRMIRCGRPTIPTMISEPASGAQLFKNSIGAPKFGRLTVEASKILRGDDGRKFEGGPDQVNGAMRG